MHMEWQEIQCVACVCEPSLCCGVLGGCAEVTMARGAPH